jgi:hypothetical protein
MTELARCPCVEIPDSLFITDGATYRWRHVSGQCCNEWIIEVRVGSATGEEAETICEKAWNSAPRADQ